MVLDKKLVVLEGILSICGQTDALLLTLTAKIWQMSSYELVRNVFFQIWGQFYLEAWNGNSPYSVDRVGRGSIYIPSLCLSVFGGLQPGRIQQIVNEMNRKGAKDDGLLQRFQLLVYPEKLGDWRQINETPDLAASEKAKDIYHQLASISLKDSHQANTTFIFDDAAQKKAMNWFEDLENRLMHEFCNLPAFEAHMAKYRSLMPALALIFFLIKIKSNPKFSLSKVDCESTELAIEWCHLLEQHAKKIYCPVIKSDLQSAQALAERIRIGIVVDGDKVRDVYRNNWAHLNSPEKLEKAIEVLTGLHWVRIEKIKSRGGSSVVLRINPAIG